MNFLHFLLMFYASTKLSFGFFQNFKITPGSPNNPYHEPYFLKIVNKYGRFLVEL